MTARLIEVGREFGGLTFHARVEPQLAGDLEALFHVLGTPGFGIDGEPVGVAAQVADGAPLWWGFAYVSATPDGDGGYRLQSPDFFADPPQLTDDLTPVFRIRRAMQGVCLDAGGAEEKTYATDVVIVAPGWETAPGLRLTRDAPVRDRPAQDDDSGWFVEPLPVGDEHVASGDRISAWPVDQLSRMRAWRLLAVRPEAVWPMNLPTGFTVDVVAGEVVRIQGSDGTVHLAR